MRNIVVITSETAGRVAICGELARRLEGEGYRVIVGCLADISESSARLGREFVRLQAGRAAGSEVSVAELAEQLASLRADLFLVDIELASVVIAASTTDARIALWTSLFSVFKRPGIPPLHTSIVPGRGWRGGRIGIEWAWFRFRIGRWLGRQRRRIRSRGADRISLLRAAAVATGFPFDREAMLDQWLVPFTYRSLPILAFNTRELEFPHDPYPTVRYVGPILSSPHSADQPGDVRQRLADLYDRREQGDSSALIYCSFGAWHKGDDTSFLRRVIDAVAAEPTWDVVLGLGGRMDPALLGEVPANVHLFGWAPQREVISRSDAAIHHAGVTSVNECVASGVPMVLYPFEFLDQRGNAARIAFHGLGVVGDRSRDSASTIRERVRRVLSDEAFRESGRRMRECTVRDQEENVAVKAVVALLNERAE
jgi:UDP:flavonoid glycosyltransferase YjiC (YdhE family)